MGNVSTESAAGRRIDGLLDAGSFVEIGGAVKARATDFGMQEKETPADGVITGYGLIDGNLVYVYSQDASVLNGAVGEMHAKKIVRIYDLAMKMGAPVIGLVDSAGFRLQEASDALEAFGTIYQKQSLASGVIPQITAVFGGCGGGLAVIPGLTDFTFLEASGGKVFVNSPNAIPGNEISKCDTSSPEFQSESTGLIDETGTEEEILAQIRTLICMLPCNNEEDVSYEECTDDLNRPCAQIESGTEDTAIALMDLSDSGIFFETKRHFARDMVTGFIKLNGMTVGAVANRSKVYNDQAEVEAEFDGSLSADGASKAAACVEFCDAFNIPVLTLTNVSGFAASKYDEMHLAKAAAKLTCAFANATVPKVNVIMDKAFGTPYLAMNSKSVGADMVYAWPQARIGTMDPMMAAKIMYAGEELAVIRERAAEYSGLQESAKSSAGRGYVDTIIEPADTRKYVIGAFEMLFTKREERPLKKHGTV